MDSSLDLNEGYQYRRYIYIILEFVNSEVFNGLFSQNWITKSLNDNSNSVVSITLTHTMLQRKVKVSLQGIQCFILPDK